MNTVKKIVEEIRFLPEMQAREVLDFVGYLKSKLKHADKTDQNVNDFDQFGSVFDGNFDRDACYDRQIISCYQHCPLHDRTRYAQENGGTTTRHHWPHGQFPSYQ